jgi:hypothetical protein
MDGFARPASRPPGTPQPAQRPQQRPVAPVPQPRPVAPQYRPAPPRGHAQDPYQQQAAPAAPQQRQASRPRKRKGSVWGVVLQFIIGLLVIAGVAAAIVALYIRYYQ